MEIFKNNFNRFEIKYVIDPGFGDKKVKGINGFHGWLGGLIGLILEKIFHKTVAIQIDEKTFYFNCKSLVKWFKRIENQPDNDNIKKIVDDEEALHGPLEKLSHNSIEVKKILLQIADFNEARFRNEQNNQQEKLKKDQEKLNGRFKAYLGVNLQRCRDLIEEGADVNPREGYFSPLSFAAELVDRDEATVIATCDLLLEKGADINMRNYFDELSLEVAVKKKSVQLISWFIKNGADVNLKTSKNQSFLELAQEYKCSDEIIKNLEAAMADKTRNV